MTAEHTGNHRGGSFAGHIIPGSLLIIYNLWAVFNITWRIYSHKITDFGLVGESVPSHRSSLSFPLEWHWRGCRGMKRIPIDSLFKCTASFYGVARGIYYALDKHGKFVLIANVQHSAMFAGFALSGVAELMQFGGWISSTFQIDYLFYIIALFCEGLLFLFHLHERTPLDGHMHLLVLGLILLSIVALVYEAKDLGQPVFALLRCWSLMVQGTWLWQIGIIIFPVARWMPRWDEYAVENVTRATNLFCYHILVNFVVIILSAVVMGARFRRLASSV